MKARNLNSEQQEHANLLISHLSKQEEEVTKEKFLALVTQLGETGALALSSIKAALQH